MCTINADNINNRDNTNETRHTHSHEHPHGQEHTHEHEQNHAHTHEHIYEQKHIHEHTHGQEHTHEHGHTHSHAYTKSVLNRLSRAIGHLESIKRMIESGRDCSEVLVQLAAVRSAINNTGKIILKDHMEHCIVDAIESGDLEAIKEFEKAIDQFIK